MRQQRWFSITGAVLAGAYAGLSLWLFCLGYFDQGDPKGNFVFMQLPIAFQLGLISVLGLERQFDGLSWFWAYLIFWPPTALLLYGFGWVLGNGLSEGEKE